MRRENRRVGVQIRDAARFTHSGGYVHAGESIHVLLLLLLLQLMCVLLIVFLLWLLLLLFVQLLQLLLQLGGVLLPQLPLRIVSARLRSERLRVSRTQRGELV